MELILFTKGLLWEVIVINSPSNIMCLPPNPMRYSSNQLGDGVAYTVEYRVSGPIDHAQHRNMPCSLCEATGRDDIIMIPSHYVCPDGWNNEYNGYIMAGYHTHKGGSMYYCIDKDLEQVPGSGGADNVQSFYTVRVSGPYVPTDGYALSCVECTK